MIDRSIVSGDLVSVTKAPWHGSWRHNSDDSWESVRQISENDVFIYVAERLFNVDDRPNVELALVISGNEILWINRLVLTKVNQT